MRDVRRLLLLPLIVVLAACGGVEPPSLNIHVPELDTTQYNDDAYVQGWELLKSGNSREALERFQESNVEDEKLFVAFGYAFMAQNKLTLARRNFEKTLELNPDNLQAQFGMASMYELLENQDAAFHIYSKIRAKNPENAWAKVRYDYIKTTRTQHFLEMAEKYKNEARKEEYIGALQKASAYSPEMLDIEIRIADFHNEDENYSGAARHYENILEKQSNSEEILVKLAEVYEKNKSFDSAVVMYKKLLELKPGDINYINKVNDLKVKFYDLNLPEKFKNIFFKQTLNREDFAALIGHYFDKYMEARPPVIITDIGSSFAKAQIIRVCTLKIMDVRPDHSFDRFSPVTRAGFAVFFNSLLNYLEKGRGYTITFSPLDEIVEPVDISPLHKNYNIIKYLVNSQLIKLGEGKTFNPTRQVTPTEVMTAIRKIINGLEKKQE